MARGKNKPTDYSAFSTPVGQPRGHWILWKPGIDPLTLYKKSRDYRAFALRNYISTGGQHEYELIREWTSKNVGELCFIRHVSHDSEIRLVVTAEDRVVLAVGKIQLSQACADGWLDPKVLTEAHDLAWQTLTTVRNIIKPDRKEKVLDDAARALENLAKHVDQLDQDLAAREDHKELERLKSQYLDLQQRTGAITENVKIARKFLADHPEL